LRWHDWREAHPSQALVREVFTQAVAEPTRVTMPFSVAMMSLSVCAHPRFR
jgi:hypothetical protein